jgi:hypothetical protein
VLAVVLKKKEEAAARTGGVNSERESAGRCGGCILMILARCPEDFDNDVGRANSSGR